MQYILMFCRIAIGLVFVLSVFGKVRDFASFRRTIQTFDLLPTGLVSPSAFMFLAGELVVIGLMLLGQDYLSTGFLLATTLLIIFSLALASALKRQIVTSCNCFGPSQKVISAYDLVRNTGFVICAMIGLTIHVSGVTATLAWIEIGFMALMSILFVLIWTNLEDIAQLFLIKGEK